VNVEPIPTEWGASYDEWLTHHRAALEIRDWATAFKAYPWVKLPKPPLARLNKPLTAARIGLISSGGIATTAQPPFDAENLFGDASFRSIAGSEPLASWRVYHSHYDTTPVQTDYNTVFPLDVLRQLAAEGYIGSVAPEHYTFMGYQPDPRPFFAQSAPKIRDAWLTQHVDAALLVPG